MAKTKGYESHATTYDEWFDENPDIYQAEISAVKQLLPSGKGIEIGAGSGRFTAPLKIDTGIEPALAMREQAKLRGLSLIEGTAEQLPVADNEFDFAIFITSTCFLDDPLKAYQEAARVTKENGKIIIAFLEKNSELGKLYEAHKADSPFYCDATFYSYKQISGFLNDAGYKNLTSVQTVLPEHNNQKKHDILPGHDQGTFVVICAEK
ncbi:class I SAM-dependent methyltransferase [Thiomicrorhabdus sp.]|uniref:class I SAM-dependent methyltransferase n=1 Tax=Thiomicrorhabdus sp. TaxID=2039724 RepID=UPI002AA7DE1F|nr:class I SAM-dependent methyltransferase [Thiomicrorhabdus sp.]